MIIDDTKHPHMLVRKANMSIFLPESFCDSNNLNICTSGIVHPETCIMFSNGILCIKTRLCPVQIIYSSLINDSQTISCSSIANLSKVEPCDKILGGFICLTKNKIYGEKTNSISNSFLIILL